MRARTVVMLALVAAAARRASAALRGADDRPDHPPLLERDRGAGPAPRSSVESVQAPPPVELRAEPSPARSEERKPPTSEWRPLAGAAAAPLVAAPKPPEPEPEQELEPETTPEPEPDPGPVPRPKPRPTPRSRPKPEPPPVEPPPADVQESAVVDDALPEGWEVVEMPAADPLPGKPEPQHPPAQQPPSQQPPEPQAQLPQQTQQPPVDQPQRPVRREPLRGVSEIRRFFRTSETPVWFVSGTAFNLLGIDRWVRNFTYVAYYDSFDGKHPNVFAPTHLSPPAFESIEQINAYLLSHKEVVDRIRRAGGGKALFLMFDQDVERLAREAGLELAFPPAALRNRLDSKIETTRLGNEAGVPSVPNVLGRARSYEGLLSLARSEDLGTDLVVQTPYGDSGQTTFFVASEDDFDEVKDKLVDEHLKVMKRINCREAAIEGVITRHGTLVGPLMTELTGFPELTPYGGGWCGNDVFASALTPRHRELAREYTKRLGDRLAREGYRGYFEIDVLADMDNDELYLGELNPRVTGASSMTNVTAVAYGDMPLFLFHLLEFMDVDYEIDVDELNEQWAQPSAIDEWSQFILKDTAAKVELITHAPPSGVWRLDPKAHGGISFQRHETDWHTVANEDEAFYLRIAQRGGYRYPGADIGILVTRGRLQTDDHELTDRARTWITGIKKQFETAAVGAPAEAPAPQPEPFTFKLL